MNYGEWKMTKAQHAEILELIPKAGFTLEEYENGLVWKAGDSFYFQAIAMISGLEWLIANKNLWKKLTHQSSIL